MRFRHFSGLFLLLILLLIGTILLSSCAQDDTAPTFQAQVSTEVTEETVVSQDTVFTPQQVIDTLEPFSEFECLYCHTDQERLIELALPAEETESLSSGPG